MTKSWKAFSYGCLTLLFLLIVALFGFLHFFLPFEDCHLPDESRVRQKFDEHRAEFFRLVDLLNQEKAIHMVEKDLTYLYIGEKESTHSVQKKTTAGFSRLMHIIGIQEILVREDRSVEFSMWGCGSAVSSDHFMGVRYVPRDHLPTPQFRLPPVTVTSINADKLPHENGDVATGLYVVSIEPEWYIYRFEYQE